VMVDGILFLKCDCQLFPPRVLPRKDGGCLGFVGFRGVSHL
jgi:hypothetical protein